MRKNKTFWIVLLLLLCVGSAPSQPPDTLWTYTYASLYSDEAYGIAETQGGFVIGGSGWTPDSGTGGLVVKLDRNGHECWVRSYAIAERPIRSLIETMDGGLAMTGGDYFGPLCVMKTDQDGAVEWIYTAPDASLNRGVSIVETIDRGAVVLSAGGYSAYPDIDLVRFDSAGCMVWSHAYGGGDGDLGGAMLATTDGGFAIFGSTSGQAYVLKTDSTGAVEWSTTFGASGMAERLLTADVTAEGDYIAAGWRETGTWTWVPYVARISSTGDSLWTAVYPELGQSQYYSVRVLPMGLIALGMHTGSNYQVAFLDLNGSVRGVAVYGTSVTDAFRAMCTAREGGLVLAGFQATIASNSQDIWVVRTASLQHTEPETWMSPSGLTLLGNYPNPFNARTMVEFVVPRTSRVMIRAVDLLGREVGTISDDFYAPGRHTIPWECRNCASGTYWITMTGDGFQLVRKTILLR